MYGHILVDFDGTMAVSIPGDDHLADEPEPIPRMVERINKWISAGIDVRVFTARCDWPVDHPKMAGVRSFCRKHFGKELPVTNMKNGQTREIWDDRAVSVERNEGNYVSYMEGVYENDVIL